MPRRTGPVELRVGMSTTLRDALQRMWLVADRRAKYLALGALLLMLGSSVVAATAPLLLKILVDTLGSDPTRSIEVAPAYFVLFYALAYWFSKSLGEMREMFLGRTDQRVQRQLSNKFFGHVISLPLRFHLSRRTGALSQTLTNGLLGYRVVLYHLINSVLPVLIELATMGTILIMLGQTIFLLIIGMSVVFYAIAFWIGAMRVSAPSRDASTAQIHAGAVFTDSILNFETVKCFNGESHVQGRFLAALRNTENRWANLFARKLENGIVIATIFALSIGLSVFVAVDAVQNGGMSIGDFVLVNAYIIQLIRPVEMLGFAFRDIVQGVAFIEKTAELLDEQREADIACDGTSDPVRSGELAFEKVSFAYGDGRYVLREVEFVIPPGKTLAVVGSSGSGKSSLIRLLMKLLEPTSGRISLGGVPLSRIPVSSLRNAIAVVPQDTALFNDSIAYNIAFGKLDCTHEEIIASAKVAGIHDFIIALSDGYDTMVGERGVKLSGGEKQRIAIARAAIKKPEIFVFDEATSSLDSRAEQAILSNFVRLTENTTAVIIAHRLSTIIHADEIVVMDQGSIVERGTHGDLISLGGVYATMWRAQRIENEPFDCKAKLASQR